MSIKLYGYTKSFDDGDGGEIVLSCNARLFVLYRDIVGNDLISDFIAMQNRIARLQIECTKHISLDEYSKLGIADIDRLCKEHSIPVNIYDNIDFVSGLLLCMHLNSLSEADRQQAIVHQYECLPANFALRQDVISGAMELLQNALIVKKKD